MPQPPHKPLRLTEWAHVEAGELTPSQRRQLNAAALAWKSQQGLPTPPLSFSGPDGCLLCANQYVGVVEVDGAAVEIYPKLDADLISNGDSAPIPESEKLDSVMSNLLWMLEVSQHRELVETDTGHLEEAPTSFFDLFAFLLGKNLLAQLVLGVSHQYVACAGDLPTVRGKIRFGEQVSRNWNRFDRIACAWDEFTPNTPVNQLLKCACRFLVNRVSYREAARLLVDCLALLDEVEDVSPSTALRNVQHLPFERSLDRFRLPFDLARRLLMASGHALGVGGANTYVFLINMNQLFEDYVLAALEARFNTKVSAQDPVGYLFPDLDQGRIQQKADYLWWNDARELWIGDAKYKHLAKGQTSALRFKELPESENGESNGANLAGRILSAADVRQLTVYSELKKKERRATPPKVSLMLLYPFVGPASNCKPDVAKAWNGDTFWLVPVPLCRQASLASIIPPLARTLPPS